MYHAARDLRFSLGGGIAASFNSICLLDQFFGNLDVAATNRARARSLNPAKSASGISICILRNLIPVQPNNSL
jgi:hypothetical protein